MADDMLTIDVEWQEVVRWRKAVQVPRSAYEQDPDRAVEEAICAAEDWGFLGVQERTIERVDVITG